MPLHPGEPRADAGRHRAGPDARRLRLFALVGVVTGAVVLPYAVATAGSERGRPGGTPPDRDDRTAGVLEGTGTLGAARAGDGTGTGDGTGPEDDAGAAAAAAAAAAGGGTPAGDGEGPWRAGGDAPDAGPSPTATALAPGLATTARCGPELASPEGIEAQTCVLTQGERTWGRTYYRNVTARPLDAVLSLLGPAGRTLRTRCPVAAGDAPESCDTPRERARGPAGSYTAVAEFADRAGYGPLLLRTGSNSPARTGS
ncbi:hypothetical protein [Streptomyces fumanus]|uniref:Uncharacterized protein n=1 Tax=Streptomyces fumanus TaxID=67302 RepID=A0A919A7M4_9ACTN|nr:hypothetical protein [Streptomyces fumanus]GHE90870.1 hypothetical protein GCM10018772_13500 [Streptomyces fumanus]